MDERTESRVLFLASAALAVFGIFAPFRWHEMPSWVTNSALLLALFLALWAVGIILPSRAKGGKKMLASILISGGLTALIAGIVLYLDASPEPPKPPEPAVLLDCSPVHALPAANFDSIGNIPLIVFRMDDSTGQIYAGIMNYSGGLANKNAPVDWGNIFPKKQILTSIYKCDFTSLSSQPVFNISIAADVEFREAIPHPNLSRKFDMTIATLGGPRLQDGDVVTKTSMKIDVRRADSSAAYTLYAVNLTQFFVFAKISNIGAATETGGWRQRQIGITTSGPPIMAFAPSMWLP